MNSKILLHDSFLLYWNALNAFPKAIIFGILSENWTSGTAENLKNKLQLFLYKYINALNSLLLKINDTVYYFWRHPVYFVFVVWTKN